MVKEMLFVGRFIAVKIPDYYLFFDQYSLMYKTIEPFDGLKKVYPHCSAIDDNIYAVKY